MQASKSTLMVALAMAMGVGALLAKSPGAWGVCASWGALALSLALWERARRAEDSARAISEIDQRAYLGGVVQGGDAAEPKLSARSNVKTGALLSLAAMVALMGACVCALGSFAIGLGWGLLGCAPLAALASQALRELADEDVSRSRLGGEGADVH